MNSELEGYCPYGPWKKISNTNLVVIASVLALELFAQGIINPILPLYLTSIGITSKILGLMFSVVWIGMAVSEGTWGWISDKLGPKIPLAVGTFLSGLLVLSFTLSSNVPAIFTIFLLWGATRSAIFGPTRGYIGINAPPLKKATFMAIFNSIILVSSCFGALPSGFIADALGYHWSFYISFGISFLAGIVLISGFKIPLLMKHKHITTDTHSSKHFLSQTGYGGYRTIMIQCIVAALAYIGFGLSMTFLPLLATQVIGVDASEVGILYGIAGLITAVFAIPIGMLADRKGRRGIMILGLLISASSLAGVSYAETFSWLMVFFVVFEIGLAIFNSAALALLSERASPQQQGTAMGFYGAVGENVGMIAGATLGGVFWNYGGAKTFLIGTATSCLGIIICLFFIKAKPRNIKPVNEI